MKLSFNVQGSARKVVAKAIAEIVGGDVVYKGALTFAYEVGCYSIDKDGKVTGEDNLELEVALRQRGFEAETRDYDDPDAYKNGLDGMGAEPTPDQLEGEAVAQAEREMDHMNLENENVPDWSNLSQSVCEETPDFEDLELTECEELKLGYECRENYQGENCTQASDVPEPEIRHYRAELSDPEYPDRMEVFSAEDDEDAIRQAYEYAVGEVVLLELLEMDDDYNVIRSVDLPPNPNRLTIEIPLNGFTLEKLDNLFKLVNAKATLLKAALGADELPIELHDDKLLFPWFSGNIDAEHTKAYSTLISLLCKSAIEKKRVTAKIKDIDGSPKYAMRCFMLSLGFIGDEYKAARKILLSRLDGNSSWKYNKKTVVTGDEVSE